MLLGAAGFSSGHCIREAGLGEWFLGVTLGSSPEY